MVKVKVVVATLIATCALGAVVSGSASASEWFVNGTKLTGSAALGTKAAVATAVVLSIPGAGTEVSCTGLEGKKLEIIAARTGKASSLIFSGCSVPKPTTCKLATASIATEPLSAEVTMNAEAEDRLTVSPQTAKLLATMSFTGSSCALAGEQAVKGKVTTGMPTGLEEQTEQSAEGLGTLENNSLEAAGDKAYITTGNAGLKLASSASFGVPGFAGPSWQVEGVRLAAGEKPVEMKLKAGTELKVKTENNTLVKIACNAATVTGDIVGSAAGSVGTDTHKLGLTGCKDTLEEGCEIISFKNKEKEETAAGTIGPISVGTELVFPGRVGPRTAGELFIPLEETAAGGIVFVTIELKKKAGEICAQENKRFNLAAAGPGGPVAELRIAGVDATSNQTAEKIELRFPPTPFRRVSRWLTNFYANQSVTFRLLNGAAEIPLEMEGTLIMELTVKDPFGWVAG
jgi:hypothetical protein